MKTRDPEKLYFETNDLINKTYKIESGELKTAVKNIIWGYLLKTIEQIRNIMWKIEGKRKLNLKTGIVQYDKFLR